MDRESVRAALGVKAEEKLLITVGRLIDSKRVCDAVAALAAVRSRGHVAKLVVVGDGPNRAALETQGHALDVGNAVTFAGNRSDVIDLLRGARICFCSLRSPKDCRTLSLRRVSPDSRSWPARSPASWILCATERKHCLRREPDAVGAAVDTCCGSPFWPRTAGAAQRRALDNMVSITS